MRKKHRIDLNARIMSLTDEGRPVTAVPARVLLAGDLCTMYRPCRNERACREGDLVTIVDVDCIAPDNVACTLMVHRTDRMIVLHYVRCFERGGTRFLL